MDWSDKHVQNQLSTLQGLGLLEVTRKRSRWNTTQYQLTFPAAGLDALPMRTDVDGFRLMQGPKKAGRGGAPHHKPKSTGTPVPVDTAPDQNSGSGQHDVDRNPSSGQSGLADALTGTPVPVTQRSPELEFPLTGTGVPQDRNSSSPDHKDQTKTNPVVTHTPPLTSAPRDHEQITTNQRAPTPLPDLATAYRAARRIVDAAPRDERDRALTQAARELAERGIVDIRQRTVRAGLILGQLPNRAAQEGPEP
jgi:hypothetical protein